ncbi:hypothetical protein PQX77_011579 [Marasmius sp. AFHP31]|nr:hypothetical protein PQX77_011579 [Marasmius sp. AFHP31]
MFSQLFSIALLAVTMVSSRPLATREEKCFPNFQGEAISIVAAAELIAVDGVNSFFIQQDGQDPSNFIIKDAANPNNAVTAWGNDLDLKPASDAGNKQHQLFEVICASCAPVGNVLADGCTIQANGQNLCLDALSNVLQPCDGSGGQLFSIAKSSAFTKRDLLSAREEACTPNFEGNPITVFSADAPLNVWGVTSFLVQQDGQDPSNFLIKNAADPNMAVTVGGDGDDLILKPTSDAGNRPYQLFEISCQLCLPVDPLRNLVADACTIQVKDKNPCLDAHGFNLQGCDGGADQLFTLNLSRV